MEIQLVPLPLTYVRTTTNPRVSTYGASDAQVHYNVTGGTPPYTFTLGSVQVTSSSTDITLNGLPAADPTNGKAHDSNKCSYAITAPIKSPTVPTIVDNIFFSEISTAKSTITIEWDAPFDGYSDFINYHVSTGVFNDLVQDTNWSPEVTLPATNRSYTFV